jgi:hypothetical protein
MANIFMMNKEIARGMVCFFHQKKHFYLINCNEKTGWATVWATFFTNSSGHPGYSREKGLANQTFGGTFVEPGKCLFFVRISFFSFSKAVRHLQKPT